MTGSQVTWNATFASKKGSEPTITESLSSDGVAEILPISCAFSACFWFDRQILDPKIGRKRGLGEGDGSIKPNLGTNLEFLIAKFRYIGKLST